MSIMKFGVVEEFQGLKFTSAVTAEESIVAVIGRNGAGKTRLLRAIAEGRAKVADGGEEIPPSAIRLMTLADLQPSLVFGFDPLQHQEQLRQAVQGYHQLKGRFQRDPYATLAAIGSSFGAHISRIAPVHLAFAVSRAAKELGKDPNELADDEVMDYLRPDEIQSFGVLNVSAALLAYFERQEKNDYAEFRNNRYGESNPHYTPSQFVQRFGPPPWILFNKILADIFDERYYVDEPTRSNRSTYDARLRRKSDDQIIDPSWLSSGERVLMWLGLSMYASRIDSAVLPPRLLLLDEPDGVLHPQMVQKLHAVLHALTQSFNLKVIFTTHSPTTVALFDAGPIWRIDESSLVEVDKEAAIADLLFGLESVYVHYAKARPVYVESHNDADLYTELFGLARRWDSGMRSSGSVRFVPSGAKLPEQNLRDLVETHFEGADPERISRFVQAVNGQGDCSKVFGAVESLGAEDGAAVHGIVDWDLRNVASGRVHVLGKGLFYSIENAVLNPLTLGLYLLHNFGHQLDLTHLGLDRDADRLAPYASTDSWQEIADAVTKKVLDVDTANRDVACAYPGGTVVHFDRRYVHMRGHDLHDRLLSRTYPFLKSRKPNLLLDVVRQGMGACSARSMPMVFVDLFREIQSSSAERKSIT